VGASTKHDAAIIGTQTKDALIGLGWEAETADAAIRGASARLGAGSTLDRLTTDILF
jgi:hypothetical protein